MTQSSSSIVRGESPASRSERDLVVAIDVSPSMLEEDYPPTRLAAAQTATLALITELRARTPRARVGIVGFGERATVACRLAWVNDAAALQEAVNSLSPIRGTNVAAGLLAGRMLFNLDSVIARQELLLLSDGRHNSDEDPFHAARILRADGVLIQTRGIGSREAVDEELLTGIASFDTRGGRLYEFLSTSHLLTKDFRSIGGITR